MEMQWWGHSKVHGWVVLDRSNPLNAPGLKENLTFMRCKDSTTFVEKRKNWNPPAYSFAPNYLRDLGPEQSAEAVAALEEFKSHWPDYQKQMQREQQAIDDQAAALVAEAEALEKEAAKEKKKQAALVKKLENATA